MSGNGKGMIMFLFFLFEHVCSSIPYHSTNCEVHVVDTGRLCSAWLAKAMVSTSWVKLVSGKGGSRLKQNVQHSRGGGRNQ